MVLATSLYPVCRGGDVVDESVVLILLATNEVCTCNLITSSIVSNTGALQYIHNTFTIHYSGAETPAGDPSHERERRRHQGEQFKSVYCVYPVVSAWRGQLSAMNVAVIDFLKKLHVFV